MKIKIAIAEDSAVFRKTFMVLMKRDPQLDIVLEAENGVELLAKLETVNPEIILLDVRMPLMDGFETARVITVKYPLIKVVAFTQFEDEDCIIEMNKIGVSNFIRKDQIEDVPRILKIIHSGGVYFPQRAAQIVKEYLNRIPGLLPKCPFSLTDQEMTLLRSIGLGLNRTQIGALLNKSPRTIEKYRSDLYQKFNVRNQQQLISEASKWSLLA